ILEDYFAAGQTFINNYRIYDYSLDSQATYYASNITIIDGFLHFDFNYPEGIIRDMILGVSGNFNLENAVAALAVGNLLKITPEKLREAFLSYEGVHRRFEFRIRRKGLVYIDDYAHHPEELKACIGAARDLYPGKKITGIFQPHLFSRTRDLADDFARSLEMLDELLLLDIYPARELPIEGVTSQLLLDRVNLTHKKLIQKNMIQGEITANRPEILLTMGAGDIDQLVGPITETLTALKN
ncbi:MAG: cyanophycin synthetase, partial [Bacteroidota bacterium]